MILCCVLLWGGVIPLTAQESDDVTGALDFRLPGGGNEEVLSADQLFDRLFDHSLAAEEQAYLQGLSALSFRYSGLIPNSIVTTHYHGETATLDVQVPAYTYTANNGVQVSWIPQTATLGETTLSFAPEGEGYACQFGGLLYSDDFPIQISFAWEATLPATLTDELWNRAFADGSEALELLLEYETKELQPYREALARYEAYRAYLQAVEDHRQYLADLEAYATAVEAYEAYRVAYEAYSRQLEAYLLRQKYEEDLQHYYDYQNFLKNDLEKYNNYLIYRNQVDAVWKKLGILEALFTTDSNKWQMYASIMGDTVTTVVARKAELITAGCNAQDIESAGAATVRLRPLLKGYADLRQAEYPSEHARVTALYTYYTQNYTALRDTFAQLYGALVSLYDNEFVVLALNSRGKLAHFQQFVGQLYVTVTCLDDSEKGIRMENWRISGKTLAQVVEPAQLLPDTIVSDPAGVSMPAVEVEKVEKVEPIEKPTVEPPRVEKPLEPARVEKPVEPACVAAPDTANPPPEAPHPGEMPPKPALEASLEALAEAIRGGKVIRREPLGTPGTLCLEKTISCPVSIQNLKTVTFYDYDGTTVLDQQMVDYGQSVTYAGPSVKKEDGHNTYEFLGWVLADGSPAVFSEVRGNLSVYASYKITPRTYRITWILDGVEKVTYCRYGEMPTPPFAMTKPDDTAHSYVFSGWDTPVVPAAGDATYVGSFLQTPHRYTVTWVVGGHTVTQQVEYGAYPAYPEGTPTLAADDYFYEFMSWDRSLLMPVTSDVTFTASFRKQPLATAGSGTPLSIEHGETSVTVLAGNSTVRLADVASYAQREGKALILQWNSLRVTVKAADLELLTSSACRQMSVKSETALQGELLTLRCLNQGGKEIALSLPLTAEAICLRENGERYAYYFTTADGYDVHPFESADVSGGFSVLVKPVHAISVAPNEFCHTSSMQPTAAVGDWVSLEPAHEAAYEIVGAAVTLANGSSVAVTRDAEGKLGFFMPAGEVQITLQVEKIAYRVTFLVNGTIYAEQTYAFGDTILPPADPTLPSDGVYTYTFSQWSPLPTLAVGEERELVFEAVISKTLLEGKDPYHSGNDNNRFLTTYLPIALGVVALAVGAFFLLRHRKKKMVSIADTLVEETPVQDAAPDAAKEASVAEAEEPSDERIAPAEDAPAEE